MKEPTEPTAALAAIAALLVAMFFIFRSLPWPRRGSWRRIWALATMAALVVHPRRGGRGYIESLRGAERERILVMADPLTGPSLDARRFRHELQ